MPPQAATAGDGTRGTRPSPHLDGLYADALRRGTRSRCSPQAYRRAVELGPEGVGSSRSDGSAGLCPTWQRSQRRDTERWAAWGGSRRNDLPLRALPPCDSMAYLQMRRGAIPRLSVRPYGESADCGTLEQKALAKPSRHLMAAKTSGLTESREPGPLPAFAICVLFDRVEDAKGHSAGHSKAS